MDQAREQDSASDLQERSSCEPAIADSYSDTESLKPKQDSNIDHQGPLNDEQSLQTHQLNSGTSQDSAQMTPTAHTTPQNNINHIEIEVKSQEPQPESKSIHRSPKQNPEPAPEEKDYYDTVDYDQMIQNQVKKQEEMRENRNAIVQLRKKRKMAEQ